MSRLTIKKGIKRLLWVVSVVGALFSILLGIVAGDVLHADYGYLVMSIMGGLGMFVACTAGWLLFVWGLYFLVAWIVKGFIEQEPQDGARRE